MNFDQITERVALYRKTILKRWYVYLITGILFAVIFVKMALDEKPVFTANTAFLPPSGQAADLSPISMILGSAGIPGTGGQSDFIPLLKSRTISEKVVDDSTDWEGQKKLIADLVIEKQPKLTMMAKITRAITGWITGKYFDPPTTRKGKVVLAARLMLTQQVVVEGSIDPLTPALIHLKYTHSDPQLIKIISNRYVEVITNHYKKQRTEKSRKTYEFYVMRTDSVSKELEKNLRKGAKIIDEDKFRIFAQDEIPVKEIEGQSEVLKQMYAQLVTMKESALNNLLQETPVVQIVDKPDPPYDKAEKSVISALILGIFLGVLLGVMFVVRKLLKEDIRNYLRQVMEAAD